jgi:hypothetical protein
MQPTTAHFQAFLTAVAAGCDVLDLIQVDAAVTHPALLSRDLPIRSIVRAARRNVVAYRGTVFWPPRFDRF